MQGSGLPGREIPPISQPESTPGGGVAAEAALAGIARRIRMLPARLDSRRYRPGVILRSCLSE